MYKIFNWFSLSLLSMKINMKLPEKYFLIRLSMYMAWVIHSCPATLPTNDLKNIWHSKTSPLNEGRLSSSSSRGGDPLSERRAIGYVPRRCRTWLHLVINSIPMGRGIGIPVGLAAIGFLFWEDETNVSFWRFYRYSIWIWSKMFFIHSREKNEFVIQITLIPLLSSDI